MFALLITTDEKITPLQGGGIRKVTATIISHHSVPHSYMCKLLKAFAACKHMLKAHVLWGQSSYRLLKHSYLLSSLKLMLICDVLLA